MINKNDKLENILLKEQFNVSNIRVSAQDYEINLEKIISVCKIYNTKLIFIKMPINLSLPLLSVFEKNLLKDGHNLSKFYFDLAVFNEQVKDYKMSNLFLKKAIKYQILDCYDDGITYQKLMEGVAYKHNIPLVDAAQIFRTAESQDLFNEPHDPIHPNSKGHNLIANAIYTVIAAYGLLKG